MSRIMLQLVGGGLYLLNKIFLDLMERRREKVMAQLRARRHSPLISSRDVVTTLLGDNTYWFWKLSAWAVYLLGLPPIVVIFFREHNWLFGCVELGGIPAMLCGLIVGIRRKSAPQWLERIALFAIPVGLVLSIGDFRTIPILNHVLEFMGAAGFLVGSYLLSKDHLRGYDWFMLMNLATGTLLFIEHYPWFVPQQVLSIVFIIDSVRRRLNAMKGVVPLG